MSPADWEHLIGKTRFGRVARVRYVGTALGPMLLVVRRAPDRDPPHERKWWRTGFLAPHGPGVTQDAAVDFILARVEELVAQHEVREQMTVGGTRVRDPHRMAARCSR